MEHSTYFTFTDEQCACLRKNRDMQRSNFSPHACRYEDALRAFTSQYPAFSDDSDVYLLRSPFMVDVDKILHNPFYNRCADKTQVFSFFKNDDLTRRALHLQLVSHIARTIGHSLCLDTDLIEAIALGHDMGHTPFGHAGEALLNTLSIEYNRGRYFKHNVQGVRLLKTLLHLNLTLQTYDGILCHNGERDFDAEYYYGSCTTFAEFETVLEECTTEENRDRTLRPGTLEGCVVRISDMLAYLGKDRQDAVKAGLFDTLEYHSDGPLGKNNLQILDRTVKNLVKNSMGKPYLKLDSEVADDLNRLRKENNEVIYQSLEVQENLNDQLIDEMMRKIFKQCLCDLEHHNTDAPIFTHHLAQPIGGRRNNGPKTIAHAYEDESKTCGRELSDLFPQQVIDYIASMTDDYFVDLYRYLFPQSGLADRITYHPYF